MLSWVKNLFRHKPSGSTTTNVTITTVSPSLVGPKIVVMDYGCNIPVTDLQNYANAQLIQCNQHFALPPPAGWGLGVQAVRVADANNPPQPDEWIMGLFAQPDQPNALGYHDKTDAGLPFMKIFPLLDPTHPWTITASHETLETLGDPELRAASQGNDGRFYAKENCDATENDYYLINGVPMSNFVLLPYFEPTNTPVKLDWMGLITAPLEIRPGGYNQVWDPTTGWNMLGPNGASPARKAWKDGRGEHARSARRQALFNKR